MADFERRDVAGNAVATTVSGAIASTGAITPSIDATTGWPDGTNGPFYVLVNEVEQMLVTSRSSAVLTIASGGRGLNGTSATTHAAGVPIVHIAAKPDFDEANKMVSILGNGTAGLPIVAGGAATAPSAAALTATGLASDSVTTAKILADNVTAAKLADGCIDDAAKLASDVVTTAKILDANVTAAKLATDAVETAKIKDSAVTAAKIAAAVAGAGLAGGAGTALSVNVDDSTIAIPTDTLLVKDGGITLAKLATTLKYYLAHGGDIIWGFWTSAPSAGHALIDGSTITSCESLYPETWANCPVGLRSGSDLVLPDWQGLFPVIYDPGNADYNAIGDTGGAATVTLDVTQIPAHTHSMQLEPSATLSGSGDVADFDGAATQATGSTGGGLAHENRPPFVTMNAAVVLK